MPASIFEPSLADPGPDSVEVEVDVDVVGHRLRVGVFGHQVLPEETEGLLAGGGGQADEVCVEVLQHPTPHPVDRAVCLVNDYQVERLRWHPDVVGDRDRVVRHVPVEARVVALGSGVAGQYLVDPLDRGDHHAGAAQHARAGQLVHVVQLGEPSPVVRSAVVLELGQGLVGQVVAVDQEQHSAEATVLEQPVALGYGGVGLAGTGGHLHQRAVEPLLGQRALDSLDRRDLGRA